MIGQIANVVVAFLIAVFFIWLFTRTLRMRIPILRWVISIILAIPAILVSLVTIIAIVGIYRLNGPVSRPIPAISASGVPPAKVAQAQKMAILCAGCHSANNQLPLTGAGQNFLGGAGPPFGTLYPPNLTPAGPLKDWSDGEIARAIREGIANDGHPLMIMPSDTLKNLSDDDTAAMVAYLRSQPALVNVTPERSLTLPALVLVGAGLFPTSLQPPITAPVVAPPRAVDAAYGKYLVDSSGCRACHGPDLASNPPGGFGPPSGPNLTLRVPTWTEDGFIKTIRTGVDPTGVTLNPDLMPRKEFNSAYDDDQLQAIYAYLHGLTPIQR